ncbi:MAG: hypothetical protein ACLGI2_10205 [Acidimicrobiia bacterium]
MSSGQDAPVLVEVHIVGMPVDAYREASEHGDELMREFALLREQAEGDGRAVPVRLLALAEELRTQFGGFTTAQEAQLQEALAGTGGTIDLHYRVPADVKDACIALAAMLDEADEYCRQGRELLTLATPPRARAFRKWFLDQFVRQVDGLEPTPWQEPA